MVLKMFVYCVLQQIFFALHGLRLAYACTSEILAASISENELPWHINAAAEIAGSVIFDDIDFIEKSKEFIDKERCSLFNRLQDIGFTCAVPLEPYVSECKFILLKLKEHSDMQALDFFIKKNILVKTCLSFKTLSNNHIRIAVRSKADNEAFIKALL